MSTAAAMQHAKAETAKPAQQTSQLATQSQHIDISETQHEFADQRPQTTTQRKLHDAAKHSPQSRQFQAVQQMAQHSARSTQLKTISTMMNTPALQRLEVEDPLQTKTEGSTVQREATADVAEGSKPNNTGLPDNLKSGIESLSGMSMDHVKVHYNSSQPAQLNAHAYAQGSEIHVAPGQEQHVPHEAWHVVQQAQGRVKPTMQMKAGVPVNDDAGLEAEADVMGAKALGLGIVQMRKEGNFGMIELTPSPVTESGFSTSTSQLQTRNALLRNSPQTTQLQAYATMQSSLTQTLPNPTLATPAMQNTYHGALQMIGSSKAAIQRKWLQHGDKAKLLRWESLVNGLRWYLIPDTGTMFFQIEAATGLAERQLSQLEAQEGPRNARTVEAWCSATTLFEASSSEPAEVERSVQDLGPTTARGVPMARVGFGTDIALTDTEKGSETNPEVLEQMQSKKAYGILSDALATGYTVFDTAHDYGTTSALGRAIHESGVAPQDIFIIYKIKPLEVKTKFGGSLSAAVSFTLKQLGRDYLDVLMLHDMEAPKAELQILAREMKHLVERGAVRYLGLSNVSSGAQIDLCANEGNREIGIRFLENKMHPHRQDEAMRDQARARGMTYIGYSILGSGNSTGKCGHVVSSEPDYDVREDERLRILAEREHMGGGAAELALAWGVQEGTVQIPKTADSKRMRVNRRAGTKSVSKESMEVIRTMDDVITDDDQAAVLEDMENPRNQLKLAIANKTHWKMIDALYSTPLGPTCDAIGAIIAGDKVAKDAFIQLLAYIAMIDAGQATGSAFISEMGRAFQPGDYSRIIEAFTKGPRIGILKDWWSNTFLSGGCVRARTRVFGYIANGMSAATDTQLDTEDANIKAAVVDRSLNVEIAALGETYPEDLRSATADEECYGDLGSKKICFKVIKIVSNIVSIKIIAEM